MGKRELTVHNENSQFGSRFPADCWHGYSAGGNGVNTSVYPFDPPDRLCKVSAVGELGAVYGNGVALALSARFGETNVSEFNSIGAPSNDGPKSAGQAVLTLGYLQPSYFVGGFAGIGKVRFVGFDADLDATYQLWVLVRVFGRGHGATGFLLA